MDQNLGVHLLLNMGALDVYHISVNIDAPTIFKFSQKAVFCFKGHCGVYI